MPRPAAWANTVGVPPLPREDLGVKGRYATALGAQVSVHIAPWHQTLTTTGVVVAAVAGAVLVGALAGWALW